MKKVLFISMLLLGILLTACSKDNENVLPETVTIDYYGTPVPYTPMAEQDYPEWLKELKQEMSKMGLYRICQGTLNDEVVHHLNYWADNSIIGPFYDKDGQPIVVEGDFMSFMSQIRDVRCIYYLRYD